MFKAVHVFAVLKRNEMMFPIRESGDEKERGLSRPREEVATAVTLKALSPNTTQLVGTVVVPMQP